MTPFRALLYGCANLGYFVAYSAFNTYVLFFYTAHLHVSPRLVGHAWLLFGIWNTINDLLTGWISDRLAERPGGRLLPIALLSLPTGLAFFLVWSPPEGFRSERALFGYFLLLAGLYDLLQTAVNTSQTAAFPEVVREGRERFRVAAIRQGMALVGTALGVAASPLLYGTAGWAAMGALWGALASGGFLLSLAGLRSALPRRPGPEGRAAAPTRAREALLALARNAAFRSFLAIQLALRFALAFVQTAMPFYAALVLRIEPAQLSSALGTLLGAALLSLPLWPRALRRWEARQVGLLLVLALLLLLGGFLRVGDMGDLLLVTALLGPAYGGLTVILDLLYAQVVDTDRAESGHSRAGIIGGITGTALRLSPALAGLVLAELLAAAGYRPEAAVQPSSVAVAVRWLMVGAPGIALALTAWLLLRYPLRGRQLMELAERLRAADPDG